MELLVVMAILSLLMGFGIGMFQRLTALGRSEQAESAVLDLVRQAKDSSRSWPSALVLEPGKAEERGRAFGLVFRPIQMSNFEPPAGEDAEAGASVHGYERRDGAVSGDGRPMPRPAGRFAGCYVFEHGGKIDFGNYSDYDLREGVSVRVWVYPTKNRSMVVLGKGQSYGIALERGTGGPFVDAWLTLADPDDPRGSGERIRFRVPDHPLVLNRWNGIEFHYDRTAVVVGIDSYGRGTVERLRTAETRAILPDAEASLCVGSDSAPFTGRIDDLVVSGILSGDPVVMPDQVSLLGERRTIRFLDGKLDPAFHRGPETIAFEYNGVESAIVIEMLGAITRR